MTIRPISEVLKDLNNALTGETVKIGQILEQLHERGFGFIMLIFALPMALPIPVPPGINILLATPLLLLTAQQALGRHTIWMPRRIVEKAIKRDRLEKLITGCIPWMQKLETLVKPRLGFLTQGVFSNLVGVLGFIMALMVCIPLPLSNTVPSFGIALMAVGVIMRDGASVLAGAIIGTAWVCLLTFAIIFLGMEGIDMIKETIKSYL